MGKYIKELHHVGVLQFTQDLDFAQGSHIDSLHVGATLADAAGQQHRAPYLLGISKVHLFYGNHLPRLQASHGDAIQYLAALPASMTYLGIDRLVHGAKGTLTKGFSLGVPRCHYVCCTVVALCV